VENRKYYQVLDELASLREASPFKLSFSQLMEHGFQLSQGLLYRDNVRFTTLFATVLLCVSFISQLIVGLDLQPLTELGRVISIVMLLATYAYVARSKSLRYQQVLVNINALLVACTILFLCLSYPAPFKHVLYTAILLIEIGLFALIRVPFASAFFGAMILLCVSNIALYLDALPVNEWMFLVMFLLVGTSLPLIICYRNERVDRENYLKSLLMNMERDQLKLQNGQLSARLSEDPVTRLLNRRTFEDAVLDKWNRACQNRKESVLVAISIESLKALNQMRGSDAGNDLLKSVARQIKKILFEADDVASRISGGRFCVLLSNASASEIARRMEKLQKGLSSISLLQDEEVQKAGVRLSVATNVLVPDVEGDSRDAIVQVMRDVEPLFYTDKFRDVKEPIALANC